MFGIISLLKPRQRLLVALPIQPEVVALKLWSKREVNHLQMLLTNTGDEVMKRLYGIAFTDSVHGVSRRDPDHVKHFIQKRCRNWVRSNKPLDTREGKPENDCLCVSAGLHLNL